MDRVGSDAARYLEFQKLILWLYVRFAAISICITMPVNISGKEYKHSEGTISVHTQYYFLKTTMQNLNEKNPLIWMHLAIFYLQSFAIYRFIFLYRRKVVRMASETVTKSPSAACTVKLYGLPSYSVHDIDLKVRDFRFVTQTTALFLVLTANWFWLV
eukprot:SAG31_NODE_1708_length_7482_cov_15.400108_4_plen_158_part_00